MVKANGSGGPTYVLHCKPGHIVLTGAAPSFDPPDRAGLMLNRTRTALEARPAASEADRADVEAALREVDGFLAVMRGHGDEAMRGAALLAIDAALLLGLNHGGGPDFARRERNEAEAAGRGQGPGKAQKANRERRNKAVAIALRLAEKHWERKPTDRASPHRTAKAIARLVWAEVQKMPVIPSRWTFKSNAQFADMLRQFIPKSETVDG